MELAHMTTSTLPTAHTYWDILMKRMQHTKGQDDIFERLVKCYTASDRHYHNLNHIISMIEELTGIADIDSYHRNALELATWFHDAHYIPGDRKNKEYSASIAYSSLKSMGNADMFSNLVSGYVLATKHTELSSDHHVRLMVDADLRILGTSEEEFDAYEANIRKEYRYVEQSLYIKNRKQILESFLARKSIYQTQYFKSRYEDIARNNVQRSIAGL